MNIELLTFSDALANSNVFIAIGLFALYLVIEILDSSLTFSLTQHKARQPGIVTFVLYSTLAIEIVAVVSNYLYILSVALGAGVGAYLTVQNEKKKRPLK